MKTRLEEVRRLQKIAGILKENAISEYEKTDISGGRYKDDEGNIGGRDKVTPLEKRRIAGNKELNTMFATGPVKSTETPGQNFARWAAKNASDERHYMNMLKSKLTKLGKDFSALTSDAMMVVKEMWNAYGKKKEPTPPTTPQAPAV